MARLWYDNWDDTFDLSGGGNELSFRKGNFGALLVETEEVRLVSKLSSRIDSAGLSTRYYIIGDRGFGKSTLLNYMAYTLYKSLDGRKALPVYVTMSGEGNDEKSLEFSVFDSLVKGLFDAPSDSKRMGAKTDGIESIERLAKAEVEYKNSLVKFGRVSLEFVYTAFENQLRHISTDFKSIVFLIDGLDKYEPEVVLKFLRKSQERLNSLIGKYSCLFFYAADPTWVSTLESREFSGVKGHPIKLRGWTSEEVMELIRKRLETLGIFVPPFRKEAVELLVKEFHGNPRLILQYGDILLRYAARQRFEEIGPGLTKEIVWTDEQKSSLHQKIIQDDSFVYPYEKLRRVVQSRPLLSVLVAAYGRTAFRRTIDYAERASIGITLDDTDFERAMEELLDRGCLRHGATEDFVQLNSDIFNFFEFVKALGASFEGLPVVFEEFEAQITKSLKPPREDMIFTAEVISVFQAHPHEWLDNDLICEILLQNPSRARSITERYGDNVATSLPKAVQLAANRLRNDRQIAQDFESKKMRWKGMLLDQEFVGSVSGADEIDLVEKAMIMSSEGRPRQVPELCRKALDVAIARLLKMLAIDPEKASVARKFQILGRLKIELQKPIPLETYVGSMLTEVDPSEDAAKILIDTCKLYVKLIHDEIATIRKGDLMAYVAMVQDPVYYSKLKELEGLLRGCVVGELSKLDNDWWDTRVPNEVKSNCESRKAGRESPYPWLSPDESKLIEFADFSDYVRIICNRNNFKDAFERIFRDSAAISLKLRELEPIRNDIAHSRDLKKEDADMLTVYTDHIRLAITSGASDQFTR